MSDTEFERKSPRQLLLEKSHIPRESIFFERFVPILLVTMGVVMVLLTLFAAGVLLGVIKF